MAKSEIIKSGGDEKFTKNCTAVIDFKNADESEFGVDVPCKGKGSCLVENYLTEGSEVIIRSGMCSKHKITKVDDLKQ
jgi:hypothetical protein